MAKIIKDFYSYTKQKLVTFEEKEITRLSLVIKWDEKRINI